MLKQVAIECDVPDGWEAVAFRAPRPGEKFVVGEGNVETAASGTWTFPYLIVRKVDQIPDGIFWLERGDFRKRMFVNAKGESLYRTEFDYEKWLPRVSEFPPYVEKPKMVPLGPEDIVPGTVIQNSRWRAWYYEPVFPDVAGRGVCKTVNIDVVITFSVLQSEGWLYKTPSMTEWAKCEKVAT